MLISHLFTHRKKTPKPRFAPGIFLGFLLAFVLLGQTKPIVGLVGIGTTLVITGVLVVLNRQRIWDDYVKAYKKRRGVKGIWTKPNDVYYTINVLFLWPFIIFLGLVSLLAAYVLA